MGRATDTVTSESQYGDGNRSIASKSTHYLMDNNTTGNLNETLNAEHLDLDPDDESCMATVTRFVASVVALCCTPSRMLVTMRLLKAITFSFLVLTIASDAMYIFFVDFMSEVGDDGWRGMIIRFYGILLSVMAIMLELDVQKFVKNFQGLKGFIPRSLLLFLIAVITIASPVHHNAGAAQSGRRLAMRFLANDDNAYYNDDLNDDNAAANANYNNYYQQNDDNANYDNYAANDDNANYINNYAGDDRNAGAGDDYNYAGDDASAAASGAAMSDVPVSAIAFQMVTSWVLVCCALCYFLLGLFCCDRFTSKAFMSTNNPVDATRIPQRDHSPDRSIGSSTYRSEISTPYVKA